MTDIAIIGGGPAGLAAALYALRGGASVRLFEELYTGGQIVRTDKVENYPGMPDAPDGVTLGMRLAEHAEKFGLVADTLPVTALRKDGGVFTLTLGGTEETARAVILCMGATPRKLGVPREDTLPGVSYCATCDGAFYRGRRVAVVGGGDTAVSDAVYLSALCERVTVVHRRDALRAAKTLQDAAFAAKNIDFVWDSVVTGLTGEDKLSGLTLRNRKTGEESALSCDGVFVAVGVEPHTALVQGLAELDASGAVATDMRMQTSIPGLYAAGDVRNTPLRQVVTACADGAVAASEALAYIRSV